MITLKNKSNIKTKKKRKKINAPSQFNDHESAVSRNRADEELASAKFLKKKEINKKIRTNR